MRYLLLIVAVLIAVSASAFADDDVPSTAKWALQTEVSGDNVAVNLSIDNPEALWRYDGLVQRTWTDIALSNGASIDELSLGLDGDPVVVLNFAVVAGSANTAFTFSFAGLSFPTIIGEGTATAAVTVTDNDGNGATGAGMLSGQFYQASYNSGTNFWTGLSGPVVAPMWGSSTGDANIPPWQAMGSVNQIASQFNFSLTAGDGASGTSSYVVRQVVPEPSSLVLSMGALGFFGAFLRRRRS